MTTDYDIFQKIKTHLLDQKSKSKLSYSSDSCAYRGISENQIDEIYNSYDQNDGENYDNIIDEKLAELPNDAMCAVGCIIEDEFYYYELEDNSVDVKNVLVAVMESNPDWNMTNDSLHMLMLLQKIHDLGNISDWIQSFNDVENFFTDKNFDLAKKNIFARDTSKKPFAMSFSDHKTNDLYSKLIADAKATVLENNSTSA